MPNYHPHLAISLRCLSWWCSTTHSKGSLLSGVSLRRAWMKGYMVNNFPLWGAFGGVFMLLCMYECNDFLVLHCQKFIFMQGYRRCQLVHLELWGKGIWRIVPLKRILQYSHIQQPALFSALCPYCTPMHGLSLWRLYQPNENYIHTRTSPAIQPTLCNRWALGPGCLSLIAFLKQDQTGSVGGGLAVMWIWWVQQ